MINEGIVLMIVGMSVVFAFLYLMIKVMDLSAFLINRFVPAEEPVVPVAKDADAEMAAAAAAARRYHEARK